MNGILFEVRTRARARGTLGPAGGGFISVCVSVCVSAVPEERFWAPRLLPECANTTVKLAVSGLALFLGVMSPRIIRYSKI